MNKPTLTFSLGDLLGAPRLPPSLLKDPCEVCGKYEATTSLPTDSKSFGGYESVKACKKCYEKYKDSED